MSPIAGWYDDPRDDNRLRYWDGDAWTDQVAPKQTAQAPPAPSAPPVTPPATPEWHYPGAPPAQQQTWNYGAPPQPTWPTAPTAPPGHLAPYGLRTSDGVAITSWGKRLAARLLDIIVVSIGSLPFTGYFLYHFYQALSDQLDDPSRSPFNPTSDVITWEIAFMAMSIVIGACYEVFCLRQWGATVGKRILEIQVRSYDRPGLPGWPVVIRRVGFMYGISALGLVPVISILAAVLAIVNYLWPLWDKKRQALHDRVAGTVVVENPRQRALQPGG